MGISLTRMLQSFGQPLDDLPTAAVKQAQQAAHNGLNINSRSHVPDHKASTDTVNTDNTDNTDKLVSPLSAPERAERICAALAQVQDIGAPTPLTDRYLVNRAQYRAPNRPPFDPDTLWYLKYGCRPIMTELVEVVNEATLNAMPIEAVAILDRINGKLKRYRDWSGEMGKQAEQQNSEHHFVIDKLITESIPEALYHYEQLLRFSPHRTKKSTVQGNMTASGMLTDLFLEIDYKLDELLDELHKTVLNRLASTHRYVKSRTQN